MDAHNGHTLCGRVQQWEWHSVAKQWEWHSVAKQWEWYLVAKQWEWYLYEPIQ